MAADPQQPRLFFYCAATSLNSPSSPWEFLAPYLGVVEGANGLERVKDLRTFWARKCGVEPEAWGVYGECVPADELAELRRKAAAFDAAQAAGVTA